MIMIMIIAALVSLIILVHCIEHNIRTLKDLAEGARVVLYTDDGEIVKAGTRDIIIDIITIIMIIVSSSSSSSSSTTTTTIDMNIDYCHCHYRLCYSSLLLFNWISSSSAGEGAGRRADPHRLPDGVGTNAVFAEGPSELHKQGHMTTGHRLFCKEFLRFNTMPCRHMPLLVHF